MPSEPLDPFERELIVECIGRPAAKLSERKVRTSSTWVRESVESFGAHLGELLQTGGIQVTSLRRAVGRASCDAVFEIM